MRQPCAKPNCVSTVRAAVSPKFSTRYFRRRPIATASSRSARCPAKRIAPPSGSSSSSSLWCRSSARMAGVSFELNGTVVHLDWINHTDQIRQFVSHRLHFIFVVGPERAEGGATRVAARRPTRRTHERTYHDEQIDDVA